MVERSINSDPRREFSISSKTPLSDLGATFKEIKRFNSRASISEGMIINVYELAPQVTVNEWLPFVKKNYPPGQGGKGVVEGFEAFYTDVSLRVGSALLQHNWELHSPEVVYMSAYYTLEKLREREAVLMEKVRQIEENEIHFRDDIPGTDYKQIALQKAIANLEKIQRPKSIITEGFSRYKDAFFSGKEDVLESLQQIIFPK